MEEILTFSFWSNDLFGAIISTDSMTGKSIYALERLPWGQSIWGEKEKGDV